MNEIILDNYLSNIQDVEPEYMTEGIREFLGKFNKAMLKKTADRLHAAFTNGDAQPFELVAKETAVVTRKMPKYQEVKNFIGNFSEENPGFSKSVDLSRKVLKNSFKIKDKAKLEIAAVGAGVTSWIRSKGGKIDPMKMTKVTLQEIGTRVNNIYDTGFEDMDATTPEEEQMKKEMVSKSHKQEKVEMIVVGVILSVLAAVIIWAGMSLWAFVTSPFVGIIAAVIAFLIMFFKVAIASLPLVAGTAFAILQFMKMRES